MSWWKNIGRTITKAVKDTGHEVGKVASNPIVDAGLALIPGVGPGIAAGAAGLGRLMAPGGNIGNALKSGVETYGVGRLAGAIPGVGGAMSKLKNVIGDIPGASAAESFIANHGGSDIANVVKPLASKIGDTITSDTAPATPLGKLKGALEGAVTNQKGGIDLGKIAGLGLTASSVIGANQEQAAENRFRNRQEDLQNHILTNAQNDYASRQPLRDAAMAKLGQLSKRTNILSNNAGANN